MGRKKYDEQSFLENEDLKEKSKAFDSNIKS